MRRLILPIALLVLAVAVPGAATGGTTTTVTKKVKLGDDFYSPTKVTIHQKDIVKWIWVGADGKPGTTDNQHTATDSKGKWTSKLKTSGTFSHRFKQVGNFKVICSEHPEDMILKVKVKAPS
jgi:plastocyanin